MNPNESLEQPHALESVPTETLDSNQLRREVWSEDEIPFAVAERIVIERLKVEVRKHNLAWLESLSLEVKRGGSSGSPEEEANYVLWIGSGYRGIKPTLEECIATGIETPEQKRIAAINKAKKQIADAEAELAKLTAETKYEGAD